MTDERKWSRLPLKSHWYDDHFGTVATRADIVENRIHQLDERVLKNDEEGVASQEVERFFDLFDDRPS